MELALYCPEYGYYENEKRTIGKLGDFFTSVGVGSLFGEMLAFQFAEWLQALGSHGEQRQIIEAGAHDGTLARDILGWLRNRRPGLFARIQYVIVEPSSNRQSWQRENLREFAESIHWLPSAEELQDANGIIFSNELLDAFPVKRFGWDAKKKIWFEWGVAMAGNKLFWTRLPASADLPFPPQAWPSEVKNVLPDGFIFEFCPGAEKWWRNAAVSLRRGKLLTLDYGLTGAELFLPERTRGTLRAFRRHRASDDLLANPGEQDLTAHVNFSVLQSVGESAGLKTEAFVSQAEFLTRIAEKIWKSPEQTGGWTPARTRQFQTLTHPEHLGRAFSVLVQARGG